MLINLTCSIFFEAYHVLPLGRKKFHNAPASRKNTSTQASAGRDMPATKELRGQDPNVPNLGREALSMMIIQHGLLQKSTMGNIYIYVCVYDCPIENYVKNVGGLSDQKGFISCFVIC